MDNNTISSSESKPFESITERFNRSIHADYPSLRLEAASETAPPAFEIEMPNIDQYDIDYDDDDDDDSSNLLSLDQIDSMSIEDAVTLAQEKYGSENLHNLQHSISRSGLPTIPKDVPSKGDRIDISSITKEFALREKIQQKVISLIPKLIHHNLQCPIHLPCLQHPFNLCIYLRLPLSPYLFLIKQLSHLYHLPLSLSFVDVLHPLLLRTKTILF
jgi:hypothetical protein